jgi:hypothetical protein
MLTKSVSRLALTACFIASSAASGRGRSTTSPVQDNANRIFNSIHHAMRQWAHRSTTTGCLCSLRPSLLPPSFTMGHHPSTGSTTLNGFHSSQNMPCGLPIIKVLGMVLRHHRRRRCLKTMCQQITQVTPIKTTDSSTKAMTEPLSMPLNEIHL